MDCGHQQQQQQQQQQTTRRTTRIPKPTVRMQEFRESLYSRSFHRVRQNLFDNTTENNDNEEPSANQEEDLNLPDATHHDENSPVNDENSGENVVLLPDNDVPSIEECFAICAAGEKPPLLLEEHPQVGPILIG